MKKTLTALLVVVLMLSSFSVAQASDGVVNVEYFDDGSYVVTVVDCDAVMFASSTIRGRKTSTYYRADGKEAFALTVYGTFSYDGTNQAVCTDSSYTHTIYRNDWSLKSASATKSGNTATATGTFIRKALGVTVDTKVLPVSLSCDKDGNLS